MPLTKYLSKIQTNSFYEGNMKNTRFSTSIWLYLESDVMAQLLLNSSSKSLLNGVIADDLEVVFKSHFIYIANLARTSIITHQQFKNLPLS